MKKIPFIVITLTLLISPLFTSDAHAAITTWEVYTYGTGEALGQIFQAIANITGSNDFVTLIKIAGIIAVLGAALYGALLDERGVKILATFFALYLLLFSVKTKVAIVDYVDPGADKVINGIPIGLAVPAHLISKIGDTLTELAEETFISVDAGYDGVKYGGNGLVGGIATMNQALAVTFRLYDSPNLRADVDQFIRDCTFQDLFTGYMSWNEIMESDDLLSEIFDTDSGNITYYHDPEDSSTTVTAQCRDVGPILKSRIQAHTNDALEKLKEEIYGDLPVDIRDKIQGAYGYYLDLSWTAKRIIEQNLLMNQLPQSAVTFAQATGSNEALLAYNLAVAQEEYRHKAEVEGFYSRKLYPVIRMVFEAICYGIWPFVFIIWLTPFGGTRALKGYFILLLALQLWAPLEAVLTLIMNIYAKHNLTMSVDYLNLLTAPHIHNYTASIFSVAWRMQTFIPIIALALATGSEYALTHMFPRLIPEGPGKDLAQGNIRLGTTSVGSHSVGVLSAMNWNAGNYSWNNLRDNNFDEHNVNRFNRNEDNTSLRNVNRDNVTERNVSQGNINRNNTTRDNVNWGNVSRNNITENNVKKFQEDTAPTQRKVVWTPYGPVEETTVTTPDGQVVLSVTEIGTMAKIHDNEIKYTGGPQTTYSPAQSAAYNLFTGMLKGMGMNEAQAERYAIKAVASGWGSIRDARQIGALANPAVAVAATTLQEIDIANKVITDPDYKVVGNPMTAIKNMVTGKVATKINEVSDKAAGKLMNAPVVKEYRDMGEKLGEAVRNNDVKTVAQMHGWSEKQAQEYINTVHQHWDNALIKGKEQSFDFSDSMRILFPSNSQLLDFNKTKLPGTISKRRPHGG